MSIESAIIKRSRPYALASKFGDYLHIEASKGCLAELFDIPLNLEPSYTASNAWSELSFTDKQLSHAVPMVSQEKLHEYNCYVASDHKLEWFRAERFIKQLQGLQYRSAFEIIGNEDGVHFKILTHDSDFPLVRNAYQGEYPDCEIIKQQRQSQSNSGNLQFVDFFPIPPYHHLLSRSYELKTSPYESLLRSLVRIESPSTGFVQILFEPARNNWHQNVEVLTDLEFLGKTVQDVQSPSRTAIQLPAGEMHTMATDVDQKAHNDKPFFFTAIRVGLFSDSDEHSIRDIIGFSSLFQHGGRPLQYLDQDQYAEVLGISDQIKMINNCLTYKPGFLLNSSELAGLIHLPTTTELNKEEFPLDYLDIIPPPQDLSTDDNDLELGFSKYAGQEVPIKLDKEQRTVGAHIIGRPGTGKTTLIAWMILQDIAQDQGVALIDPHGDLAKKLLDHIPEEKLEDTVFINFDDPAWIPLWNPLRQIDNQNIGRATDDLVSAIKSIVQPNHWGDRLEHLMRNGFYGLLHLDDSTFYDLLHLFELRTRKPSREKIKLRERILEVLDNDVATRFWQNDYPAYRTDDFSPPINKLSKLLSSDETVSLMLTQKENRLDFDDIMNSGKILLVDLSGVGPESRGILGCFLLSFLHSTSLRRNKISPENRRPFSIYCDEAHKITTDTLEDVIVESRKFGVNLTLAHQFMTQFSQKQRDALSSIGSTMIFNVNLRDAQFLLKDLQGKVNQTHLSGLKRGEAIARIGTDIVKFNTPDPRQFIKYNHAEDILRKSRERYYSRISEVKALIKRVPRRDLIKYYNSNDQDKSRFPDCDYTYNEFE